MNSRTRRLLHWLVAALFLLPSLSFAQRAVQSPLMVNVLRTRSAGSSQQMSLKVTIRNMSKQDVDVRLEALFVAVGGQRNGQDGIYCQREETATIKPSESKEFEVDSEPPARGYYTYNGIYYYYSSLKARGYMTRVFAGDQLVNVTGSTPSLQKAGWDAKEMGKLGYTAGGNAPAPAVAETPAPRNVSREESPAPVTGRTPARPVETPAKPTADPTPAPPAAPAASTYDAKTYEELAKLYNDSVDAYQAFLQKRGSQASLRRIENDLKFCLDEVQKISSGAPASADIPGFISRCQKTLFAVHGTLQTQP